MLAGEPPRANGDGGRVVRPQSEYFKVQAVATRIHAYLMALIDGRRSIRDMARMLVEQRLMSAEDAEPAVRRFLIRMSEDSRKSGV